MKPDNAMTAAECEHCAALCRRDASMIAEYGGYMPAVSDKEAEAAGYRRAARFWEEEARRAREELRRKP